MEEAQEEKKSKIKGFFIKAHIDRVKEEKGLEGLKQLEELYGSSINFKAFQSYSTKDEERLIGACLKVLDKDKEWESEEEKYLAIGRYHWETAIRTKLVYESTRKIYGRDPKQVFKSGKLFMSAFLHDVDYDFFDDIDGKSHVIFDNLDYHPQHLRGVLLSFLESMGTEAEIIVKARGSKGHECIITWKKEK